MVKKLEAGLTAEVTTPPSPTLRLAYCPSHPTYSPPSESRTGRGGEAYELEDLAGVYHGDGRSGTAAAQRISGHGESHPPQPAQGTPPLDRWRTQDAGHHRPEAGQASAGRSGQDRQA